MASVNIVINYRDGTTRSISEPVSEEKNGFDYSHLKKAISLVHDRSNNLLTNIVDEEKNLLAEQSIPTSTDEQADDGDDDESEEDNDDKQVPPEKKLKT